MITSLIAGKLIADPQSGQSTNGNSWYRITVACPVQGGKEGEPDTILATVIAFADEARKLERLSKGDAISAVGSLRLSHWAKNGESRAGLDVIANEVLTAHQLKAKRSQGDNQGSRPPADAQNRFLGRDHGGPDEFNDQLGF